MKTLSCDQPLYILPFDHRGSFVTKMFGWYGRLTPAQTAEIAAVAEIARRYRQFVEVFEHARSS
jgi:hypothetical protein